MVNAQVSLPKMLESSSRIAHDYFRINPFNKDFSEYLSRLINDPILRDSQILLKSDTSLFFMEGYYYTHRPFFFKAEKTKIILAERPDTEDSTRIPVSLFHYQLVAYAPEGKEGTADVKAEYEKIFRRFNKNFSMSSPHPLKKGETITGEVRDFYYPQLTFSPFTLAWSTDEKYGNILALTLRFQVYDNRAFLPITTDGF